MIGMRWVTQNDPFSHTQRKQKKPPKKLQHNVATVKHPEGLSMHFRCYQPIGNGNNLLPLPRFCSKLVELLRLVWDNVPIIDSFNWFYRKLAKLLQSCEWVHVKSALELSLLLMKNKGEANLRGKKVDFYSLVNIFKLYQVFLLSKPK